jgi:hypothetical protein
MTTSPWDCQTNNLHIRKKPATLYLARYSCERGGWRPDGKQDIRLRLFVSKPVVYCLRRSLWYFKSGSADWYADGRFITVDHRDTQSKVSEVARNGGLVLNSLLEKISRRSTLRRIILSNSLRETDRRKFPSSRSLLRSHRPEPIRCVGRMALSYRLFVSAFLVLPHVVAS